MDINITSNNALKLLGKSWLHVMRAGNTPVVPGGKYNAICDVYGNLGQIECIREWKSPVCELTDTVLDLAEGRAGWKLFADKHNMGQVTRVQVCQFRFLRRIDKLFEPLIQKETIKSGLAIYQQQNLF